ncbi:MAG TPA: hypothetical protein VJV96_06755 [Candidatus Angelobacter sp.]|nr:hypothetical protein [Candidatus Angelobacter sp.]
MSLTYTHTLIAVEPDYVPKPVQIAEFFAALVTIGRAPLEPMFAVGQFTGEFRRGMNPMTGEQISVPRRSLRRLTAAAEITTTLEGADDYNVIIEGKGPAIRPPFPLFTVRNSNEGSTLTPYTGEYDYSVRCSVRARGVSMSDWHEEIAPGPENLAPFDSPCRGETGKRFFHNPYTNGVIELSGAGCSRFWIEFECGKWLLPKVTPGNSLEHLAMPIVDAARELFRVNFVEGCRWG